MAWLQYSRSRGSIQLFASAPIGTFVCRSLGVWPAHNNATSTSKGPWPLGQYRWSHYNPHPEAGIAPACFPTAYGCSGIHVFGVAGRPGIGVHAGRTLGQSDVLGGKTLGCIRVPANAMLAINDAHRADALVGIVVAQ